MTNYSHSTADRPLSDPAQDGLSRSRFSEQIAEYVMGWRGRDSLVMAIYGPWGTGKTTIKNFALHYIRQKRAAPVILDFNPWYWMGQDKLFSAFFTELGKALEVADPSEAGKKRAAKLKAYAGYLAVGKTLADSVSVASSLVPIPGVGLAAQGVSLTLSKVSSSLREGADVIDARAKIDEQSLSEAKRSLSEDLASLPLPILVVMDDLDRLPAACVRDLFQLVKANADFPNVVYLMLCQRETVTRALEGHTGDSGDRYLEKIVQVGFDVPAASQTKLLDELQKGLTNIFARSSEGVEVDNDRWSNLLYEGIEHFISNMRTVRRLLAVLEFHTVLFLHDGVLEVDPLDLVALEVLRMFSPGVWNALPSNRNALIYDLNDERGAFHRRERQQELEAEFRQIVDQADERDRRAAENILRELFPEAAGERDTGHEEWFRRARVCDYRIFDRYFRFELDDSVVTAAELMTVFRNSNNREWLVQHLSQQIETARIEPLLDRLAASTSQVPIENASPFVTALLDVGDVLPRPFRGGSLFSIGPEHHGIRTIHSLVQRIPDPQNRFETLSNAIQAAEGIYLSIRVVEFLNSEHSTSSNLRISEPLEQDLKLLCVRRIQELADNDALETHPRLGKLLHIWADWGPSDSAVRTWVDGWIRARGGFLSFLETMRDGRLRASSNGALRYFTRADALKFASEETLRELIEASPVGVLSPERVDTLEMLRQVLDGRNIGGEFEDG